MNPIDHPVMDAVRKRHSSRVFDPLRIISDDTLLTIYEAARWAPSSYGEEPWRFLTCYRHKEYEPWHKLLKTMTPLNQLWAEHAPLLILCTTCLQFGADKSRNRHAEYDLGAAVVSMTLQAAECGLITRQIGGFDAHKTRNIFNIPANYALMSILAMGYRHQETYGALPDVLKAAEQRTRKRLPLPEIYFEGKWQKSIKLPRNNA